MLQECTIHFSPLKTYCSFISVCNDMFIATRIKSRKLSESWQLVILAARSRDNTDNPGSIQYFLTLIYSTSIPGSNVSTNSVSTCIPFKYRNSYAGAIRLSRKALVGPSFPRWSTVLRGSEGGASSLAPVDR
jgi:hypothetical protein